MTLFVLTGALLALLTLALLTYPLWNRGRGAAPDDAVAALRQQIDQLAALHAAGALGQAQHEQARAALEKRLVDAVIATPAASVAPRPAKALLGGLAGFVGVVAIAGYAWLGTPQALDPAAATAAAADGGHAVTAEQIEGMVQTLAARLKERPDDAQGWAMLGRSYAVLGRHEQAVPAFKQAMGLR
ncbi:MAG: c-type cytochrome biogenesis protein CcmI, partial [Aquabacterium sp.]